MPHLSALLLTGFVLTGPVSPQPGPYLQSMQVQEACRSIGEVGAQAWRARPSTAGMMQPFELRAAARVWLDQINTLHPIPQGEEGEIIRKTVMNAFLTAGSEQQAYEYGWATCMDTYGPAWGGGTPRVRPAPPGSSDGVPR